ncbi:MAG: rRNA maturation RNase YbeY [Lachnospiraceae bacterium]|nr:rRNA maturation RNase YbeY [Lachnospiraceae bacterium]
MTVLMEQDVDSELPEQYREDMETVIREILQTEMCPYECEVNITFTDDEGIREINREFRELNVPTDVLSFPMTDYENPADFSCLETDEAKISCFNPETGELLLGDIIISLDRVQEQAREYCHSEQREICFLVAHSMLHLLGYDHIEDEERLRMEKKQSDILESLGITRN